MASIIILSDLASGSITDILNGTRLQTAPQSGILTFQIQASKADSSDNYKTSIQLPSGDTPMESVLVPSGDFGSTGGQASTLDARQMLQASFAIQQGGHVVFGIAVTGTVTLAYRVTFTPA